MPTVMGRAPMLAVAAVSGVGVPAFSHSPKGFDVSRALSYVDKRSGAVFRSLSGPLLAETENVPVRIFDVEIFAGPRPVFQALGNERAAHDEFVMQCGRIGDANVRVEMFV